MIWNKYVTMTDIKIYINIMLFSKYTYNGELKNKGNISQIYISGTQI